MVLLLAQHWGRLMEINNWFDFIIYTIYFFGVVIVILPTGGSRDFPSKNDKVLWRPRRLWPPEGYYFFRDPYLGSV
nr:hypothetical protein [Salmonella enterica subsp. enterica serovar Typhimurium]WHV03160.1 hypothetical protein pVN4_00245 [Salmonella enterica subsp. enterica serovar Typhimurium]